MTKMSQVAQRYKITVAYRGTAYFGWQYQKPQASSPDNRPQPAALPTIQEHLASALATVVGHPVEVCGSSRTDARVHAKGQVAHFDTFRGQIPPENLRRAVNHRLPDDILIRRIEPVPPTFDAISCTRSKRYQYSIHHAADRPVFGADLAWHRWQKLDVAAMKRAAGFLVGTHDFATFAKPGHGRTTTVRTVLHCEIASRPPRLVIGVEGTGFLWNMVRIIAGTLVDIGIGHYSPDEVPAMLAARDRRAAGGTAPAHGLYLQWIRHGDEPADRSDDEGPFGHL